MQALKILAFLIVIGLGGYVKFAFCRKPYSDCSPDEKRIRLVGAIIGGACAVWGIIAALLSALRN